MELSIHAKLKRRARGLGFSSRDEVVFLPCGEVLTEFQDRWRPWAQLCCSRGLAKQANDIH
jgi:hypothetical protein